MKITLKIKICFLFFLFNSSIFAQLDIKLDSTIRTETIEKLSQMLNEYVYPEKGKKMAKQLAINLKNGKYDTIKNFGQFASIITKDLFDMSNDKHLLIRYDPGDVSEIKKREALSEQEKKEDHSRQKEIYGKRNFGFEEVKILPGNIGYLRLRGFERADYASETAFAAMGFLSNADVIIIDLRNNNGGWGSMVQILCSYFFEFEDEKKNILLFEKHIPYKNEVIQYRTLPNLPGKRMTQTPLYILTSGSTYSAAENFTDILQKRNRATIVGETTRGGAHSTGGPRILNDYYIIKLPNGKNINPITKTNWEGVGVEPDIKTDRKDALDTALKIILTKQIEQNSDEDFLNGLGYSLLNKDKIDLAIFIFKENIKKHPKSANCYDSLGEAFMLNGDNELAIKNYKKSLELNPNNENATKMIEKIEREQKKKQ